MIYGVGTDILNANRIKNIIHKYGEKFLVRFYSDEEIKLSKKKYTDYLFFSKRFAAKEAFWKAFSPNKNEFIKFKDIEILTSSCGKPVVNLIGETANLIENKENLKKKKFEFHISISDEPPNVLAFVIIFLAPHE